MMDWNKQIFRQLALKYTITMLKIWYALWHPQLKGWYTLTFRFNNSITAGIYKTINNFKTISDHYQCLCWVTKLCWQLLSLVHQPHFHCNMPTITTELILGLKFCILLSSFPDCHLTQQLVNRNLCSQFQVNAIVVSYLRVSAVVVWQCDHYWWWHTGLVQGWHHWHWCHTTGHNMVTPPTPNIWLPCHSGISIYKTTNGWNN